MKPAAFLSAVLLAAVLLPARAAKAPKSAAPAPAAAAPVEEPWSVKMVRSEMTRTPDPLRLDGYEKPKWTYTVGLELKAIGDTYDAHGGEALKEYVLSYADSMVGDDGSILTYKRSEMNLDMICSGRMLLWAIDHTPKADKAKAAKFKKAADLLRGQLVEQPKTSEGAYWHKNVYPYQIWLDGLYMSEPFMAEWLTRYLPPNCVELRDGFEEMAQQFLVTARRTYDPATGLYRHAWEETRVQVWSDPETGQSPHAWGRALGWYVMAIVDVLDYMPASTKGRDEMIAILRDIYEVLPRYMDPKTKMWFQVLDQPGREGNYVESTASAMFTYAMLKGVRKGYLDRKLLAPAVQAYRQLVKTFIRAEDDGTISLTKCCQVAGLGGKQNRNGSYEYYLSEPVVDNDPKGIGPFVWASLEMEMLPETITYKDPAGNERVLSTFAAAPIPAGGDEPFIIVEQMPTFKGGDLNKFRDWVQSNLRYPNDAAIQKITGKVVLMFIIEKDGSVTGVQVLRSPDKLLSDEAVRVVSHSPQWAPGIQKGQPIRVKYTLPVEFRIREPEPAFHTPSNLWNTDPFGNPVRGTTSRF